MHRHRQNDDLGRYTEHMRARARSLGVDEADIEDVVGDALLVACQQKQGRPPPEEVGRVVLWLLELVEQQHKAYKTRRMRKAREALMDDPAAAGPVLVDERDPIRVWDLQDWIAKAIPKVPEPLCSVVLACDGAGDTVPAFARERGINRKTAETWLARGRAAFREALLRLDKPKRGFGAFLPFGLDLVPRTVGLVRRAMQTLACSCRSLAGMAAAAAVLAVTPAGPSASAREPERCASEGKPVQIHAEPASAPEPALPAPPAPPVKSAKKPGPPRTAPIPSDPELGRLLAVKAALRRGNAGKARVLLEDLESAADARECEMLGAAAHR